MEVTGSASCPNHFTFGKTALSGPLDRRLGGLLSQYGGCRKHRNILALQRNIQIMVSSLHPNFFID
jgi:hypothetical protein